MNLTCEKCGNGFESPTFIGYCAECQGVIAQQRAAIHERQHPAQGICADGKFCPPEECPRTVTDPVTEKQVCGLCGSDEIEPGYGLGSGHGMGSYNFCFGCNHFLDFHEDLE